MNCFEERIAHSSGLASEEQSRVAAGATKKRMAAGADEDGVPDVGTLIA